MDLASLEAAATTSRNAVVLLGMGAGVAACLAYYFAVQKNEGKRRDLQLAAAILVIFGAGAAASNFHYTDEIRSERDRELKRFELEKDTEIKNLEKANLLLREQVSVLEKSNLRAAKEVAVLQLDVAAAKHRQAEAETRLAKVAKHQEPRNLSILIDQMASILKAAPRGKAIVWYSQGHPESFSFAISLQTVLQNAGWQTMEFKAVPSTLEYGPSNVDVNFIMQDPISLFQSKPVEALLKVFQASGITMGGGYVDLKIPDDVLKILIHPKS